MLFQKAGAVAQINLEMLSFLRLAVERLHRLSHPTDRKVLKVSRSNEVREKPFRNIVFMRAYSIKFLRQINIVSGQMKRN